MLESEVSHKLSIWDCCIPACAHLADPSGLSGKQAGSLGQAEAQKLLLQHSACFCDLFMQPEGLNSLLDPQKISYP